MKEIFLMLLLRYSYSIYILDAEYDDFRNQEACSKTLYERIVIYDNSNIYLLTEQINNKI